MLATSPAALQTTYTRRAALKSGGKHKNSDIDSLCDASFQSGGSSDDAGSISSKLPVLSAPLYRDNHNQYFVFVLFKH